MLLYGRSTCCENSIPGGGIIPSIGGNIQSPGWRGLLASKVVNIILDVPDDVLSSSSRSVDVAIRAGEAKRGQSGAARVGVNIVTHLELSGGRANVLAMVSK